MAVTSEELAVIIGAVADEVERRAPDLRALDAALGDGDLGLTFTLGASAIREAIGEIREGEPSTLLASCGTAFANANPSTMGALVGVALQAAAATVRGRWTLDAHDVEAMAGAAVEAIETRGGARVGDKTLLDALRPSVDALRSAVADGAVAQDAVERMAIAAEGGATAVDDQRSRVGRASWLGDRSRGHRDPGAQSWIIILEAIGPALGALSATSSNGGEVAR